MYFDADLSGERIRDAWADRSMPTELANLIRDASGILLIINPLKMVQPIRLRDIEQLAIATGSTTRADDVDKRRSDWIEEVANSNHPL